MSKIIISPSSLNVYINDKALWVLRTFYKLYGDSNIYAIRGILVEHAVNMRLDNQGTLSFKEFAYKAITKVIDQGIQFSMPELREYYDWGMKCYSELPVMLIKEKQIHIKGIIEGVEMHGYLDYKIPQMNNYIDLKTVNKLPIIVSRGKRKGLIEAKKKDNVRQQIVYRMLSGTPQQLTYVTPSGDSLRYEIGYRDYKEHLPLIKESLKEIKKLLTMNLKDVIIKCPIDEKKMNNKFSFGWNDKLREKVKEIYDVKKNQK